MGGYWVCVRAEASNENLWRRQWSTGCMKLGLCLPVCLVSFPRTNLSMTLFKRQYINSNLLVKVKLYLCRHGQASRILGGWGSQIFSKSVHGGGKVVCPTNRPPSPLRKYYRYWFLSRGCLPQGHSAAGRIKSIKNSEFSCSISKLAAYWLLSSSN